VSGWRVLVQHGRPRDSLQRQAAGFAIVAAPEAQSAVEGDQRALRQRNPVRLQAISTC